MADILKVYTSEQLFNLYQNYLLAKNVGLTDFNSGSKIRALIESNSEIISVISIDHKEAIYKSIPVALYEGLGFSRLEATSANGFLRLYRKPIFYIIYTGSGTSAKITTTSTNFSSAVTGAPSDAFDFAYSTYNTVGSLVSAIDALANWSAILVKDSSVESNTLYQYTDKEVLNANNYLNSDGLDILLAIDIEIEIPEGFSVSIDQETVLTSIEGTLNAGESSAIIESEFVTPGILGNISANAIDTLNGKGFINSNIDGIEQVRNDSAFSGGSEEETNEARKTRFSETINSLNAGTEAGIISAIKGITGIRSVGMRTNFPIKGTNTIIVDDGTGTISSELQAEIEKVLYGNPSDFINYPGKNAAGIGYNIVAPIIVDVNIGITATRLPGINVDSLEIKNDIQTSVEQYINTRQLGENVLKSEIIRVGKNSNAAVYDLIVTTPSGNEIIIDDDEFAKTGAGTGGTVNVTVTIATTV